MLCDFEPISAGRGSIVQREEAIRSHNSGRAMPERVDGVSALVRVRELGVLDVGALSCVLRDLVLVPRRDLRLEHRLRVAARSVGGVGL